MSQQLVTFAFQCERCQHILEKDLPFGQSPSEHKPKKCPDCKHKVLNQLFTTNVWSYVGEAKTFGQQAARNAKRLSKEEIQIMEEKDPVIARRRKRKNLKASDLPWWRSGEVEGLPRDEKLYTEKDKENIGTD